MYQTLIEISEMYDKNVQHQLTMIYHSSSSTIVQCGLKKVLSSLFSIYIRIMKRFTPLVHNIFVFTVQHQNWYEHHRVIIIPIIKFYSLYHFNKSGVLVPSIWCTVFVINSHQIHTYTNRFSCWFLHRPFFFWFIMYAYRTQTPALRFQQFSSPYTSFVCVSLYKMAKI